MVTDLYVAMRQYQMMIRATVDEADEIVALDLPIDPEHLPMFRKMLRAACEMMGVETRRKIKWREFI